MTDDQRALVRAAREAAAASREAQQRLAEAGLPREDERLLAAVGPDLTDVVYDLIDILDAHPGVTVRDEHLRATRSKSPSVVLPVEFSPSDAAAAEQDFAFTAGTGTLRVKLTISLTTDDADYTDDVADAAALSRVESSAGVR
jgi:hypothetical protein